MAIYHLHATRGHRVQQSAEAASAYIGRSGKYKRQPGILLAKGSGHMPVWADSDPGLYWKSADAHERANGRLFLSYEVALPRELSPEQQLELVQSFSEKLTSTPDGNMPFSFAIHTDRINHNPHAHIMVSERVNDGHQRTPETWFKRANKKDPASGGACKSQFLNSREALCRIREMWAKMANDALEKAGSLETIDHRKLEEQGIGLRPTMHLGPNVKAMAKKGKLTSRYSRYQRSLENRNIPQPPPKVLEDIANHIEEYEEEMNRTLIAVQRQAIAMSCELFEVGIFSPEKGMLLKQYTFDQLLRSISYLRAMNAQGQDIYIRPASSTNAPVIMLDFDEEAAKRIERMRKDITPACVIESSPGHYQAWIRLDEQPVSDEVRSYIAKKLTREYGADPASAEKRHFGRLAGFTNRKPQYLQELGKAPYVLCRESTGEITKGNKQLLDEAMSYARAESSVNNKVVVGKRDATTSALFGTYWEEWKSGQKQDVDYSKGDFAVAARLIREGYDEDCVVTAMLEHSPGLQSRKGERHMLGYCQMTVAAAVKEVEDEDTTPGY